MTSRERVSKAVKHRIPDRVPIDPGGMRASTIAAIACDKLKLGLAAPTKVIDPRCMLAAVEDDVLRRLHKGCPNWTDTTDQVGFEHGQG